MIEPVPDFVRRARELCASAPVFDAHVDALQRACDLGHDLGTRTPGQLDLVRGAEGGLGQVVLACWVDESYADGRAAARADALIDAAERLFESRADRARPVRVSSELEREPGDERIGCLLGIEGGHAIEESLERLEHFAGRGVRVLTLAWNNHLSWIRTCRPEVPAGTPNGLSPFGRDVVRRMDQLGMVVDLSHAGERAFFDALEAGARPPIASHSGCRVLHDHQRNLGDGQLRALAERGGVVGIVFHPGFLDADARAEEVAVRATPAYRAVADDPRASEPTWRFLRESEVLAAAARPMSIERLVDHVEHACEVAGPEHVGIGSDFDGIERGPEGLGDAACYPRLAAAMLARGFEEETVRGVLGDNFRRVFRDVLPRG